MPEGKQPKKPTIEDILQFGYLNAANSKKAEDPFLTYVALENLVKGMADGYKVEPLISGLASAITSEKTEEHPHGRLPTYFDRVMSNYSKTYENTLFNSEVGTILNAFVMLEYGSSTPDYFDFLNDYRTKTYGDLIKEYQKVDEKIKNNENLTQKDKNLQTAFIGLSVTRELLDKKLLYNLEHDVRIEQLKKINEAYKEANKKKEKK